MDLDVVLAGGVGDHRDAPAVPEVPAQPAPWPRAVCLDELAELRGARRGGIRRDRTDHLGDTRVVTHRLVLQRGSVPQTHGEHPPPHVGQQRQTLGVDAPTVDVVLGVHRSPLAPGSGTGPPHGHLRPDDRSPPFRTADDAGEQPAAGYVRDGDRVGVGRGGGVGGGVPDAVVAPRGVTRRGDGDTADGVTVRARLRPGHRVGDVEAVQVGPPAAVVADERDPTGGGPRHAPVKRKTRRQSNCP